MEIGPKDLKQKQVVVAKRFSGEKDTLPIDGLAKSIPALLEQIQQAMFDK